MSLQNITRTDIFFIIGVIILVLPLSSIQHFIWPVSWCLLADICNHSWIPECGHNEMEDKYRTFTDECDMFEFNCDNEKDFEAINYSECFVARTCPTAPPCPPRRKCRGEFLRQGEEEEQQVLLDPARRGRRMSSLAHTLPMSMLKGKRRYTPEKWRKRGTLTTKGDCQSCTDHKAAPRKLTEPTVVVKTMILKRETIIKNGRKRLKIIKSVAFKKGKGKPVKVVTLDENKKTATKNNIKRRYLTDDDSDFLQ